VVWAVGADWASPTGLGVDDLGPWLAGAGELGQRVTVHGSSKAAVSLAAHARSRGHEVSLVLADPVLAPELGLPGRFRLVADLERSGVTIGDAPVAADTTIRVQRAAGAPAPVVDGVEVHAIGDVTGTTGLAAALSAAAALAAQL
jgi:hypothetical protein